MVIDPRTDVGKLRLRVADFSSIPMLPDAVYVQTLSDNNGSLPISAKILATYILGMLSLKTHKKMVNLEIWGSEAFKNYKEFLLLITKDPTFMDISPIPYSASGTTVHPLQQFQADWNKNYYRGTQSQELALDASISPNDGSLYGPLGSGSTGWNVFNP